MNLTYLFDPLCGWCYGASPVLERLSRLDNVTVKLAPTGLFAGEAARPLDTAFAAYAWRNDQRIAQLTGQPFSDAYKTNILDGDGKLFDSTPATLAIVAVGLTAPVRELEALRVLQSARYVDGRDTSEFQKVAEVLDAAGITDAAHRVRKQDENLMAAYRQRLADARLDMSSFGVEGVPALILGEGAQRRLVRGDALFGAFDQLAALLRAA